MEDSFVLILSGGHAFAAIAHKAKLQGATNQLYGLMKTLDDHKLAMTTTYGLSIYIYNADHCVVKIERKTGFNFSVLANKKPSTAVPYIPQCSDDRQIKTGV
jgi:hypothetical protein